MGKLIIGEEARLEAYRYCLEHLADNSERPWLESLLEDWAWGGLNGRFIDCFPELLEQAPSSYVVGEYQAGAWFGWDRSGEANLKRKIALLKAIKKAQELKEVDLL